MPDDGEEFVQEVVPEKLPIHIGPPRDDFLPWHRVRKEYVRQFQWSRLTASTIKRYWKRQLDRSEGEWVDGGEDEIDIPAGVYLQRPLRCLVIPGDDLLDIRALVRDVGHLNCIIRYIGFNESHGSDEPNTRIYISNNAVTSLPRVQRDSRVVHDRFEMITRSNSQADRYLQEYGPYHVVNLDLCGSIFPNTDSDPQEYLNAIHKLLAYQLSLQICEWLLFITTEVQPGIVDEEKLQVLCGQTRRNYEKYADFAESVTKLIPTCDFNSLEGAVDLSAVTEEQLVQLFGVALGKWLLHLCQQAHPKWIVAMRPSYKYSINSEKGVVMLALAFEFRPNITPPVDQTGVSTLEMAVRIHPDERECAMKLVRSVAAISDIDAHLAADVDLKEQLKGSKADLLHAAGYDRAAYLKWVDDGEICA